jgi:hemerythrin superfamily protein
MATSKDALVMLKEDHKKIRQAFREFEGAKDAGASRKQRLVDKILALLTEHTYVENEVLYPRVRELVPELEDDILESYEEHHVADVLVEELAALRPEDERFTAKTVVLIESVRHHMREEEDEWFPRVREALGRKQLQEIGDEIRQARKEAPDGPPEAGPLQKAVDAVFG